MNRWTQVLSSPAYAKASDLPCIHGNISKMYAREQGSIGVQGRVEEGKEKSLETVKFSSALAVRWVRLSLVWGLSSSTCHNPLSSYISNLSSLYT